MIYFILGHFPPKVIKSQREFHFWVLYLKLLLYCNALKQSFLFLMGKSHLYRSLGVYLMTP